MSQSISSDTINPKTGSTVSIRGAQIVLNETHGMFTMTGATLDAGAVITSGYHLSILHPFAFIAIEGFGGATISAASITMTTALPEAAWPKVQQYLPVRINQASTGTLGAARIDTDGTVHIFHNPNETTFGIGSTLGVDNIVGHWCIAAF
jgi:hypothetical protein